MNSNALRGTFADDSRMFPIRNTLLLGRNRDSTLAMYVLAATLMAFVAYIARLSDVTHDAFHEIALARVWWQTGIFPIDDVFAFTSTVSPTVHHEWGTGLVLFWVTELSPLGLHGMAWLRLVLIAALAAMIYRMARNLGAHPYLVGLCAPIVFPVLWVGFGNLRAQLFTLVFLTIQLLMMQSDVRGRRHWIPYWFLLYVVWLNMHAGFVVGLALLVSHVAERWVGALVWNEHGKLAPKQLLRRSAWRACVVRYWHHLFLPPLVIAGVYFNPWGWQYVPYLVRAITMQRETMLEWQPLWMTYDPAVTLITFSISVLLLGYVAKNRRWTRLGGWMFCCLAAVMALKHLRHGSLYGLLWLAYMPGWLTPTPMGRSAVAWLQSSRALTLATAASIFLACSSFAIVNPPWRSTLPARDPASLMVYPVEACQFLQDNHWKGNMVTPFSSGGYVSWRCFPNILVSIDGRYEVAYRDDILPKHDQFFSGEPGWDGLLSEYDVDLVLVQKSSPVWKQLADDEHRREWHLVHEDSAFALFAKRQYLINHREHLEQREHRDQRY